MTEKHKLIDLFSGAGGMTAGFVEREFNGNFQSVFAIDSDGAAVETYNQNFAHTGHQCVKANIEVWLEENAVPAADVVIGGPPCQGFSLLNKDRKGDARRALWEPFMDVVEKSGAVVFVMENVPGLLKSQEFQDIARRSQDSGFQLLQPAVLNVADYGVPQTRRRAIVVGAKISAFDASALPEFPPPPTHEAPTENQELPSWRCVREAISDLPHPEGTEIRSDEEPPVDLHFGRNPTPKSLERYKAVPPGGNRFDLQKNRPDITPNCWLNKPTGSTDLFGRLWWDRPAVTIRTEFFKPEKGRYLHPEQDRPITHREAARLMTFPDQFQFCGTKIEIARQIGNAVPPQFAEHIANYVEALLEQRESGKRREAA